MINHLLKLVSVGGNGLILFKRLFRESSIWAHQQPENWDGRLNSPMVSADYDMNALPIFSCHVHCLDIVSTCGSSKLKTFSAQAKRNFDMTNGYDS